MIHRTTARPRINKAATQTSDFRPPTSVNRVKTIYDSQIGVRETGSNRGPEVEKYLRYAGLSKGNPWCAAFVCWVLGEAGVINPRSGWSPDLFLEGRVIWRTGEQGTNLPGRQAGSKEQRLPTYVPSGFPSSLATGNLPTGQAGWQRVTPGPGDIFGLYFPEKARIAHVGFVDEWEILAYNSGGKYKHFRWPGWRRGVSKATPY